ncbi:class I SAM-dependent RNA methyltransferase [Salaquimonas pukyongi]|uniref:class I SAM-dependent RNA methyltransferase n=1 Tax=Salaquimonas pukyongi TaxID=2712698 RepID=UPI00096B9D6B|nr:class I SAM-dependent RNA methyltransferase [Salaquimonas pukyongi]
MGETQLFRIEMLGHRGDGIGRLVSPDAATSPDTAYIPFTLPGETVRISAGNPGEQPVEIVSASCDRAEPFCEHFTRCGGCQLQHMAQPAYLEWKTSLLAAALEREGIPTPLQPIRHYPQASRRRCVLTAQQSGSQWLLGYSGRRSHNIIDISACPVLRAELEATLPAVRNLLHVLGRHGIGRKGTVRIILLAAENGVDCAISFGGKASDRLIREVPRDETARHFPRISLNGETVYERQRPVLKAGLALATPPPGGFSQAVEAAEEDMASLVCQHLSGCKKVADLFCGFGAFALRLAQNSLVHAAESDQASLDALDRAWRETGGRLKTVNHERRDLFRRPFMVAELKQFDGVVFDPPRAGAEAQCRALANSAVKKIAAVSCNPQTLARDLRILCDGRYRLKSITPIDQFAHTPHMEAVALLER